MLYETENVIRCWNQNIKCEVLSECIYINEFDFIESYILDFWVQIWSVEFIIQHVSQAPDSMNQKLFYFFNS